jgi:helicase
MKRIELGRVGEPLNPDPPDWHGLKLPSRWTDVMKVFCPGAKLTELQALAFGNSRILESRRNLIVSAPTNTGKSLVGYGVLLEAVLRGRRALLLEPYRALAQEKFCELERVLHQLHEILERVIAVTITTGDYRLDEEAMSAPPPEGGEIIVATPERIEAILRNPDYSRWCDSIGAVCADEAHLLSATRRGPALEYVLTTFSLNSAPQGSCCSLRQSAISLKHVSGWSHVTS